MWRQIFFFPELGWGKCRKWYIPSTWFCIAWECRAPIVPWGVLWHQPPVWLSKLIKSLTPGIPSCEAPQMGVRLLGMEPGAQLGSWCQVGDLKLCSLHDGVVGLWFFLGLGFAFFFFSFFYCRSTKWFWWREKSLLLVGIIKRMLPFIKWHKEERVYIRKILDFYLGFLGKRCLGGKREHGIWALLGAQLIVIA